MRPVLSIDEFLDQEWISIDFLLGRRVQFVIVLLGLRLCVLLDDLGSRFENTSGGSL